MKHVEAYDRHLETKDVLLLSVLGAVHHDCAPLKEIISTAMEVAPQDWQPTAEVVSGCVVSAMNTKLLRRARSGKHDPAPRIEITASGRGALRHLLMRSVPRHRGVLGRTCMAAKLCFLEYLDPDERSIQIEELAQVHRERIEALQDRLRACSQRGCLPRRWLVHEIERFQWELASLERLQSDIRHAQELERTRAPIGGRPR